MIELLSKPGLAWPLLILSTVGETVWILSLRQWGDERCWPWNLLLYAFACFNIFILTFPLKHLPTGSVYIFWTGASAPVVALMSIYLFRDPVAFWRLFWIAVTILGSVGIAYTAQKAGAPNA